MIDPTGLELRFCPSLKRKIRRYPDLRVKVEQTLNQSTADPYHPSLHTHKLKGALEGTWACSVAYDLRIIFEFRQNTETGQEEILLLTVGTHDEVY